MKLKPCPFCGSIANIFIYKERLAKGYIVTCSECMAKMIVFTKFKSQAYVEWNRRYEEPVTRKEERWDDDVCSGMSKKDDGLKR